MKINIKRQISPQFQSELRGNLLLVVPDSDEVTGLPVTTMRDIMTTPLRLKG